MSAEDDVSQVPHATYPSVVDRYYAKKYKRGVKGQTGNDFCILCHSNKICLVTLAPSHSILRDRKIPQSVSFQVDKKRNRLDNQATGKGKKGAQVLSEVGVVCIVTCSDGSVYSVYSCIKGKLVEVNSALIDNPLLLTAKTWTDGYVAIVLPSVQDYNSQMAALLSPEDYEKTILADASKEEEEL
ncbi:protein Abitram-like [Watersipora subatra]|uniref:protein Abitram-like n=1 Tax=Watersipora subatra TaxID=2589382 RepID=UPI00355ADB02